MSEEVKPNPQEAEAVEDQFVNEDMAELGPAQEAQIEAYKDNATKIVFSEDSQAAVLQQLQSGGNPADSISNTAFVLHKRLEGSMAEQGEKMTEVTLALGAAHLVSELVVLAEAAGLYTIPNEDRLEAYKLSVSKYFEAGLKDGSIDPVELQKSIEPLMSREQREYGMQQMESQQISKTAPPSGQYLARKQQQEQPQQQGILGRR